MIGVEWAGVDQSVCIALDGSQIARPPTAVASMSGLELVTILKMPHVLAAPGPQLGFMTSSDPRIR